MQATASLNTKIDPQEKREFVKVAESLGMSPSAAVRIFVKRFNDCKGFPFDVRLTPTINYENPSLQRAVIVEGKTIVPSSWRDDDDDDE